MASQLDYHTIREIFTRFQAAEPEPKGELDHVNAYTLVVAVALSAQATDAGVNRATRALFQIADTPQKMLDLGEDGLIDHIKTIGLYRNKAKNVIKLSRILVEEYDGEVPNSRAALQALPGVGRKTANVVLNMWWHYPAQAVDTHIFRVGNRTGICPGKDVVAVERAIEDNVPVDFQQHAHHWLILHGRYHLQGPQADVRRPASSVTSVSSRKKPYDKDTRPSASAMPSSMSSANATTISDAHGHRQGRHAA